MSTPTRARAFPTQSWADIVGKIDGALGRDDGPVGLALVDIDRFTDLTQMLPPHLSSDVIVGAVGTRLTSHLLPDDITALVTDDLIVIIRPVLAGPAAMEGLGLRIVEGFQQPLSVGQDTFECTVSIGVAVGRRGDTGNALLRYAHYALDDAKALGRNQMMACADEDRELLINPD